MLRKALTLISFFLSCLLLKAQQDVSLFDWQLFTSFKNITVSSEDKFGRIWCGTTGGIFLFNPKDSLFTKFNSLNGILSNNATAIYFDNTNELTFAGFYDGFVEIFDKYLNISHLTSIATSDFPNLRINKITGYSNFVYFATGFGIVQYDLNKKIFTTSVLKIADWSRAEQINEIIIFNNKIWVSSSNGIAYCDLSKLIEIPSNWKTITFPSNDKFVKSINIINDTIFFSNSYEVFKLENDSSATQIFTSTKKILQIINISNNLHLVIEDGISDLNGTYFFESQINSVSQVDQQRFLINTSEGVIIYDGSHFSDKISPNSPFNNVFAKIAIDEQGTLWSVSAHLQALFLKGGITKFEQDAWENYNSTKFPNFISDNFFNIAIIDNVLYSSSVGGGVAVCNLTEKPFKFEFLSERNEKFVGTKTLTDTFLLVGDFKPDSKGNVWFTNWGSQTAGPILVSRSKNGNSYAFINCYKSDERRILMLEVDNFNTKWVGSYPGEGIGIFYFNENNTPDNLNDDICGLVSTTNQSGLPDNSPTVIKKDPNGNIWLGFRQGLSIIFNPSAVLSKNQLIIRSINHLNNQIVNDIVFDPTGYAWIATNSGVFVLSYNTYDLIRIYNSKNSPLKVNNILSIAGNFKNGTIYFGTDEGLYTAKSYSVEPSDKYNIRCYPQPFNLKKDVELTIDGLAPNSELKITTINGELVKSIYTSSGKTTWDGKDFNNNLVSNGVYIIIGTSGSTNSTGVQKIIVISK